MQKKDEQLRSIYEACLDYEGGIINAEKAIKEIESVIAYEKSYYGKIARKADAIYNHNKLIGYDNFRE